MASATRTQTSTSRAMPQPGTPAPGREGEGNDTSSTERKSSHQGGFPKEATLPLLHPGEAGIRVLESERPQTQSAGLRQGQWPHH